MKIEKKKDEPQAQPTAQVVSAAAFVKDRHEALMSMQIDKINAYRAKYGMRPMHDSEEDWRVVHMARTAALDLPEDERKSSREWLRARGMKPMA